MRHLQNRYQVMERRLPILRCHSRQGRARRYRRTLLRNDERAESWALLTSVFSELNEVQSTVEAEPMKQVLQVQWILVVVAGESGMRLAESSEAIRT